MKIRQQLPMPEKLHSFNDSKQLDTAKVTTINLTLSISHFEEKD